MKKLNRAVLPVLLFLSLFAFASNTCAQNDLTVFSQKSFVTTQEKLLTVQAFAADIVITTWGKDEVSVKVYGDTKAKESVDVKYKEDGSGVSVTLEAKNGNIDGPISMRVEVIIPEVYQTLLQTAGGDIKVTGVTGKITAQTAGGDIVVNDAVGMVQAETAGGDIAVDSRDGSIVAKTAGGDIVASYEGTTRAITLATTGGDIALKLPSAYNCVINCATTAGDVSCAFDLDNAVETESTLSGKLNGGGEPVNCSTSGGDISISK